MSAYVNVFQLCYFTTRHIFSRIHEEIALNNTAFYSNGGKRMIFWNLPPEAIEVEVDSNVVYHPIRVGDLDYFYVFSATHWPLDNHILELLVEESAKKIGVN